MIHASIGIDCGSAACKGVLLREGAVVATHVLPTGWNPRDTSSKVLAHLLEQAGLARQEVQVTATGYGRLSIDFADRAVTEITCHALGADFLLPEVRTVVDIGGQDSKVISLLNGKVLSFQMNDKCAAGTGRFLEMSAHRMGLDLDEFARLLEAGQSCSLSSMCAVFADSEIVSLLASGKSREELAGGVINAVCQRVVALAARIEVAPPILLTGGLAGFSALRQALEKQIGFQVSSLELSRFAGAIGAAKRSH